MSNVAEDSCHFDDPNEFSNVNSKSFEDSSSTKLSLKKLINMLEKRENEIDALKTENKELRRELRSLESQLTSLTAELCEPTINKDELSHGKGQNKVRKGLLCNKNVNISKIHTTFSNISKKYEEKLEDIKNENKYFKGMLIDFTKRMKRLSIINKTTSELILPIRTHQQVRTQLFNLISEEKGSIASTSYISNRLNTKQIEEEEEEGISRDMLDDDSLNDYPLECQLCLKRFMNLSSLQKHCLICKEVNSLSYRSGYSCTQESM